MSWFEVPAGGWNREIVSLVGLGILLAVRYDMVGVVERARRYSKEPSRILRLCVADRLLEGAPPPPRSVFQGG